MLKFAGGFMALICMSILRNDGAHGQMTAVGKCWVKVYEATGTTGSIADYTSLTEDYHALAISGSWPGCYALALEYAKTLPPSYNGKFIYFGWAFSGEWGKITRFSNPTAARPFSA